MKRILILIACIGLLTACVYAEISPDELADTDTLSKSLTQEETGLIGGFDFDRPPDLINAVGSLAVRAVRLMEKPFRDTIQTSCRVILLALIAGMLGLTGKGRNAAVIASAAAIGAVCFQSVNNLISVGENAIRELSLYSELYLPTAAGLMASSGEIGSASVLYTLTVLFSDLLFSLLSSCLPALIGLYLAASFSSCISEHSAFLQIRDMIGWSVKFLLKVILYGYTAFLTISQVVSGSADAMASKAAKLTISGMIPVVGSIISDASDAILLSASFLKNSVGIFGILSVFAICILPFLRVLLYYLSMRIVQAVSGMTAPKEITEWIRSICDAAGLILAALGTSGLLMLISVVCSMKAVGIS